MSPSIYSVHIDMSKVSETSRPSLPSPNVARIQEDRRVEALAVPHPAEVIRGHFDLRRLLRADCMAR